MGPLSSLVDTFGPFLVPVAVFTVGAVGYLILLAITHALGTDEASKWRADAEPDEGGDDERTA